LRHYILVYIISLLFRKFSYVFNIINTILISLFNFDNLHINFIMTSSGNDLNLVDMNLIEIPSDIASQAGPLVTTLNLSENQLW